MKLDVIRFQLAKMPPIPFYLLMANLNAMDWKTNIEMLRLCMKLVFQKENIKSSLRTEGGFHSRYAAKYGDWHEGMLWLQDVPGFTFILIHTGNTDQHTSGCYIVGETQQDLDKGKDGFVGNSGVAYKKMYPKVKDAIKAGEEVTIKYTNIKDLIDLPEVVSDLRGQVKILESTIKGRPII